MKIRTADQWFYILGMSLFILSLVLTSLGLNHVYMQFVLIASGWWFIYVSSVYRKQRIKKEMENDNE